jgi:4-diphosphocytidyl-2-C-methyl-D-erythritol kinase
MSDTITISAPCKINLHLRVSGRRPDGFHDIESVFQLISLADELSVSVSATTASFTLVSPRMELPPVNTVSRAVDLFRGATGIDAGVRIDLDKRVPAGAGLGGGSSDAAAALIALDRLFATHLPREALVGMAEKIGSDVPFFLSSPAAIVEGRGERISPISPRSDLSGVLIWPDVHSSTAEAYRMVDWWYGDEKRASIEWPSVAVLEKLYHAPVSSWPFRNSFSDPLDAAYPVIGEVKGALHSAGALFTEMSGSGSAVFGLFDDEKAAEAAQISLSTRWKQCVKFVLLASSPMR